MIINLHQPNGVYEKIFKRILDLILSLTGLIILSPLLLILTALTAVKMKGNPFFLQERPGKNEKLFRLIKLRTMNNEKDRDGNLLPSKNRLTHYGRILRKTSLDELPELLNVIKGDMALVGPRPLLVKYLPLYNEVQKRRHEVRPGITGYAQANGRNSLGWEEKFALDVEYVDNITFIGDVKILLKTFVKVISREGIEDSSSAIVEEFKGKVPNEL